MDYLTVFACRVANSHALHRSKIFLCTAEKNHTASLYSPPADSWERATKSSTNDESGNQDHCHSILQILLRCNESQRATCFLHPLK